MQQAKQELAAVLRQQEKDAEYLYQLYTIALARFDNENARKYIEIRAALDTTNVQWQMEAGLFAYEYMTNLDKAILYYKRGLRHSKSQFGENSNWVSDFYNNIGLVFEEKGDFAKAKEFYDTALSILETVYGDSHPLIANSYSNIGSVYADIDEYDKALELFNKSLIIEKETYGDKHPEVARTLNNIGSKE